ncbi:unnamed protein product [Amoebophrya sp. A120]|nr:unnamed protein product [Amoebophrya sp. A120]|eukprot:GSA120T00024059001.1
MLTSKTSHVSAHFRMKCWALLAQLASPLTVAAYEYTNATDLGEGIREFTVKHDGVDVKVQEFAQEPPSFLDAAQHSHDQHVCKVLGGQWVGEKEQHKKELANMIMKRRAERHSSPTGTSTKKRSLIEQAEATFDQLLNRGIHTVASLVEVFAVRARKQSSKVIAVLTPRSTEAKTGFVRKWNDFQKGAAVRLEHDVALGARHLLHTTTHLVHNGLDDMLSHLSKGIDDHVATTLFKHVPDTFEKLRTHAALKFHGWVASAHHFAASTLHNPLQKACTFSDLLLAAGISSITHLFVEMTALVVHLVGELFLEADEGGVKARLAKIREDLSQHITEHTHLFGRSDASHKLGSYLQERDALPLPPPGYYDNHGDGLPSSPRQALPEPESSSDLGPSSAMPFNVSRTVGAAASTSLMELTRAPSEFEKFQNVFKSAVGLAAETTMLAAETTMKAAMNLAEEAKGSVKSAVAFVNDQVSKSKDALRDVAMIIALARFADPLQEFLTGALASALAVCVVAAHQGGAVVAKTVDTMFNLFEQKVAIPLQKKIHLQDQHWEAWREFRKAISNDIHEIYHTFVETPLGLYVATLARGAVCAYAEALALLFPGPKNNEETNHVASQLYKDMLDTIFPPAPGEEEGAGVTQQDLKHWGLPSPKDSNFCDVPKTQDVVQTTKKKGK